WYPGATEANVLVTAGAAEANFVAYWTLMQPGDALALMLPNFMQLAGLASAFGHELRPFRMRQQERGWGLDLPSLVDAASSSSLRLLGVCNPNNPTGAILNGSEMTSLADAARRADAWLLSDEIYRGSELDGAPETPTFWGRYDKAVITSSTSKSLAHAGLRIGWIVGPAALIAEAAKRQDYTSIGTGAISQYVAAQLLEP